MSRQNLAHAMGDAVAGTVDNAEVIHRRIASIPIDILDNLLLFKEPLEEVRKIQDHAIGAAYDLARGINREVTESASSLLEESVDAGKRVTTKVEKSEKQARVERVPKVKAS
jgi:hypothetical protein